MEEKRSFFLNAAFQAQAFAPQWTGSAVELEKPLSEKVSSFHFTAWKKKKIVLLHEM